MALPAVMGCCSCGAGARRPGPDLGRFLAEMLVGDKRRDCAACEAQRHGANFVPKAGIAMVECCLGIRHGRPGMREFWAFVMICATLVAAFATALLVVIT